MSRTTRAATAGMALVAMTAATVPLAAQDISTPSAVLPVERPWQ